VVVASAGPYASLHIVPYRQPRQHLTTQFFTGRMPFLPPNQQRQSTEGRYLTTLSQQMLTAVKHVAAGTSCMQHTQIAGKQTLNFTSFYNGLQLDGPSVKPTDYQV